MRQDPPRIPQITRAEWTDSVRDVFAVFEGRRARENGSENPVIRTFAQHPALAKPFLTFNRHLLTTSTLPVRLRQLAILRVAWTRCARYMWASHMRLSLQLGLTPQDFEAVRLGPEAPGWSEPERAVLRAVEQLRDRSDLDDAAWNALARHLDRHQMMDFLFTVGTYLLLALAFNAMRIELEPELQELAGRYGLPGGEGR
ncbi:MAG TPA: carboxymuconolactone decarboxylase family protein [Myxococcota bacterium]|nr:carboxymuconolactone decarboxylase family protein [Myxococcota bacterium]